MAKVIVDASVIGADWFNAIATDLMRLKGLTFVRSLDRKTTGEHERAKKLGEFYATMSRLGRVATVPANVAEPHIDFLTQQQVWIDNKKACDDPHLFAAVHACNVRYIFSADTRLAKCRSCLMKKIDRKYCGFSLISSQKNFKSHKTDMCR